MVKAARLHAHSGPLVVEDVQLPAPEKGEVRVDLAFGGVNPVDSYVAQGRVAADGPLPRILGGEASGHVDGRPVLVTGAGLGSTRDGVWASAANVPETAVVPLPDGAGLREAAAMGVAGLTAWHTLMQRALGTGSPGPSAGSPPGRAAFPGRSPATLRGALPSVIGARLPAGLAGLLGSLSSEDPADPGPVRRLRPRHPAARSATSVTRSRPAPAPTTCTSPRATPVIPCRCSCSCTAASRTPPTVRPAPG
jgi:hypothetical protein